MIREESFNTFIASLLLVGAQLTPSPQDFSSLPRVSEVFTPIAQTNHMKQEQEQEEIHDNLYSQHAKFKQCPHTPSQHMQTSTT